MIGPISLFVVVPLESLSKTCLGSNILGRLMRRLYIRAGLSLFNITNWGLAEVEAAASSRGFFPGEAIICCLMDDHKTDQNQICQMYIIWDWS
jgi:hypothetical protein